MWSGDEFSSWAETLQSKDVHDETLRHNANASGVNILLLWHLYETMQRSEISWGLATTEPLNFFRKLLTLAAASGEKKKKMCILKCDGL